MSVMYLLFDERTISRVRGLIEDFSGVAFGESEISEWETERQEDRDRDKKTERYTDI